MIDLRDPWVGEPPENPILVVEVGSTAHGTGIDGVEDHDQGGVWIEPAESCIGIDTPAKNRMQRTQPEGVRSGPGDIDRTWYPLRKFLHLAVQGNPSVLQMLWCPIEWATDAGRLLQASGELFVGRHVIPRYLGYMRSQATRLLGVSSGGHGVRGGGGRIELIEQFGYDTKYAMHSARLGFQCRELLTAHELAMPMRGEPAEWLRDVRHGRVSFEDWWERALDLHAEVEVMADDESIPAGPDRARINALAIDMHQEAWEATP